MEAIHDQNTTPDRTLYLDALAAFIAQRSGMYFHDYGHTQEARAAFMVDYRAMLQAGRDARTMLRLARLFSVDVSTDRRDGRLTFRTREDGTVEVDYVTGQYFPTEYRAAACAVLASAWWAYWDRCGYTAKGIREQARKTFGRGIASRWFS